MNDMESYLFLFGMLIAIVSFIVNRVIFSQMNPPYISENDDRHAAAVTNKKHVTNPYAPAL